MSFHIVWNEFVDRYLDMVTISCCKAAVQTWLHRFALILHITGSKNWGW